MSAFCICKDQNLGPGTGAYLVRYQCHLRVSAVHSSCNPGSWENPAMLLVWDSRSQIRRNDRVRLAANPEVKSERFHPSPELWHEVHTGYRAGNLWPRPKPILFQRGRVSLCHRRGYEGGVPGHRSALPNKETARHSDTCPDKLIVALPAFNGQSPI